MTRSHSFSPTQSLLSGFNFFSWRGCNNFVGWENQCLKIKRLPQQKRYFAAHGWLAQPCHSLFVLHRQPEKESLLSFKTKSTPQSTHIFIPFRTRDRKQSMHVPFFTASTWVCKGACIGGHCKYLALNFLCIQKQREHGYEHSFCCSMIFSSISCWCLSNQPRQQSFCLTQSLSPSCQPCPQTLFVSWGRNIGDCHEIEAK